MRFNYCTVANSYDKEMESINRRDARVLSSAMPMDRSARDARNSESR